MSGLKRILLLVPLLVFLAACANMDVGELQIADAVGAGVLISPEATQQNNSPTRNVNTVVAEVRDMTTDVNFTLSAMYPVSQDLFFERDEGYVYVFVERLDTVSYGDVLARLRFDTTARQIAYDSARNDLAVFNENFGLGLVQRQRAVEEAQEALYAAQPDRMRVLTLELELAQLELERFQVESRARRAQLVEIVEDFSGDQYGEVITAPFDGVVMFVDTSYNENVFYSRIGRMMTVAYDGVIFLSARAAPPGNNLFDVLKLGDTLYVTSSETEVIDGVDVPLMSFYARVVSDEWAGGNRANFGYWMLPLDMEEFLNGIEELENLHFRATKSYIISRDHVVLPASAVQPEDGRFFVFIYENGVMGKRYVQTGARVQAGAQGILVQILAGVEPGETVVTLP